MGKIPPSFRSAISTSLIRKPPVVTTETPSPLSQSRRRFPRKPDEKKPSNLSRDALDAGELSEFQSLFKSADLADAKGAFNSIATSTSIRAPLDVKFYNSLLKHYASISTVDDSVAFFHHMMRTQPSFSPDRSTYHILLAQACKSSGSSLSGVHRALNLMVNNGLEHNQGTTDVAIRALCETDHVDEAVDLIKEFSQKHSPPDIYTYNYLVKHLCKCRALSTVYDFVDEMRSSYDVKPNLVTYTILIDNVCNTKNLREATRLVSALSDSGFKPDCFVYNTLMKGFCMLSRGSEAIGVFNKMKEEGVEPDVVTYNTLIFGLSKSGRVREAKKYLDQMIESGNAPDTVTYTSLMNGMCRAGDALGALSLLEVMEAKRCSPNSWTYNTLLHGLCKSRLLDRGIKLYEAMKSSGMKLETSSYATFLRTLVRNGRIAEAYELFDYAVETKSLTDVAAYSALESTLKWLKKAKEQGLAV